MRTISFEGVATAITSIIHNGGEKNGIASMLRREKFVQPNGWVTKDPVISCNALRCILLVVGMYDILQKVGYGVLDDSTVKGLPLSSFYFLFSDGALSSTGNTPIN